MLNNKLPTVTTDPSKLKEQAKKFLGVKAFNYVAGGAGESATMDANRLAFRQWKVSLASLAQRPLCWLKVSQMIPRMLRNTTHRDLKTELFGHQLESPLLIAPIGVQSIFHLDKEAGVAEVAAEIGVPYILSTASSTPIEDVAKASGDGVRWFQLYWPQDDEITISVSPSSLPSRRLDLSMLLPNLLQAPQTRQIQWFHSPCRDSRHLDTRLASC